MGTQAIELLLSCYRKCKRNRMVKVSVIMPSLNVVKYIRQCVESVIRQTLKDIEIIIVDAGSTDGTLEILQQYAESDARIKLIHSEKKSYGYQVNVGLELAKGKYIGIVETDDYITSDMYKELYEVAEKNNVQYVKAGFDQFVESETGVSWYQYCGCGIRNKEWMEQIIAPKELPELAVQDYYLWSGIYKSDFVKQFKLSETPGASFQDIGFIFQVLSHAERTIYLDKKVYYYRQTRGNSSFNRKSFQYLITEYGQLGKSLATMNERWQTAYYMRMFRQTVGRFQRMAISGIYWKETEPEIEILIGKLHSALLNNFFSIHDFDEENKMLWDMLIDAPKRVYDFYNIGIEPLKRKFGEIKSKIGEDKVVIMGCAKAGQFLQVVLENHWSDSVVAMCDNNSALWNTQIQNMTVISPQEAVAKHPDAKYITTSKRYAEQMKQQLIELGVSAEQIAEIQPIYDFRLFLLND